ncbi:hypothetical protein FRB99_007620 [Tulasnella sp. 403]|nr:hypothetical protein FRB99_007620 [Tulasnella sp. 403]
MPFPRKDSRPTHIPLPVTSPGPVGYPYGASVPNSAISLESPSREGVYTSPSPTDSEERLIPPSSNAGVGLRALGRPRLGSSGMLAPSPLRQQQAGSTSTFRTFVEPTSTPPQKIDGFGTFSLSADPSMWATETAANFPEPDDELHNPDPKRDRKNDNMPVFSARGVLNVGCLFVLTTGIFALFTGYPIISHYTRPQLSTVGVNATGQVPIMPGNFGMIDKDTPLEAHTKTSYTYGQEYQLVFSDEFSVDGRTFYPGDDPYWEAVDLHYWQTNNLEWYDPSAITTQGGNLVITFSQKPTHGLNYEGGLLSTWNKFCFTGGILEVNATLPGASNIYGLWPAVWSMGNLGRAGYGASLEGLWPYSYNSCDVGTLPNQTFPDGTPVANTEGNDAHNNGALSYLPGQRLSACTCDADVDGAPLLHPGPKNSDGTYVGRASPEIDVLEAAVDPKTLIGHVSQSAQWAPFDYQYLWANTSSNFKIYNPEVAKLNTYVGGVFQQASSVVADTNQGCYELSGGFVLVSAVLDAEADEQGRCASIYGYEYQPGSDGFITWISDGVPSWTIMAAGLGPNAISGASQRLISEEPMYVILNLGMSRNFGPISDELTFPAHFLIDYVRIYQPKNQINVGCDPPDYPTAEYIQTYIEAYTNPNLTTWEVKDPNAFGEDLRAENVHYLGEGRVGCVYGLTSAATGKVVAAVKAPKPRYIHLDPADEIMSLKQVGYFYAANFATITYSNDIKKNTPLLFMVYRDGVSAPETDGWHQYVSPTEDLSLSPGMDVAACEQFWNTLVQSIADRLLEYAKQGAFTYEFNYGNVLFKKDYPQNPTVVVVDWGYSQVIKEPSADEITEV